MNRRKLLLMGCSAGTLIGIIPISQYLASHFWSEKKATSDITELHAATISSIADTIIPRTDTPSATDVGVEVWIKSMLTLYYTNNERTLFLEGLDEIEALAIKFIGKSFVLSSVQDREAFLATLEKSTMVGKVMTRIQHSVTARKIFKYLLMESIFDQVFGSLTHMGVRSYLQLKKLVVHGYFTSEFIYKEVLKVEVVPGYYDGNSYHNPFLCSTTKEGLHKSAG